MFEESIADFPNFRKEETQKELSFSRTDLDGVFAKPDYQSADLLNLLKKDFRQNYESPVGVWEGYSLEQHTGLVLGQFEKYYGDKELPGGPDENWFRLLLAVHDLGKPTAVKQHKLYQEHEDTIREVETVFYQLGFSKKEWLVAKALIDSEALSRLFKWKNTDANGCFADVLGAAQELDIRPEDFFKLLEIYYKVDASSYTKDAGGQESLDHLFVFDGGNKRLDLAPELEDKLAPVREKFRAHQEKLDENSDKIKNNGLYKKIESEMAAVAIAPEDKDRWGRFLAPNGQVSELPEKEWKMTRTPSFKNWFGDWQTKYNPTDFANWLKYQEIRKRQEIIRQNNEDIKKEDEKESHFSLAKMYQDQNDRYDKEIAVLQADLDKDGFRPEQSDYSKILDKNGEPLLVCRSTPWGLNKNGNFDVPFLKPEDWQKEAPFPLGTFFGKKREAKIQLASQAAMEQVPNIYYSFINCRAPRFLNQKYFWNKEKKKIQYTQDHYDGFLVKNTDNKEMFSGAEANFIDLVIFKPENILVVEAK